MEQVEDWNQARAVLGLRKPAMESGASERAKRTAPVAAEG
jgi:hypothetical protein